MKKHFRITAAALAVLSVISISGCAISSALEEENGFKYNSSQVSSEQAVGEIKYNSVSTPSAFGSTASPSIFSTYTGTPYETVEGDLWVSPDGSDETGDGTKANPYATFAKAQSVVREIKAAGKLPSGTFTVVFMPGEYRMTEGLKFTEEDSGTDDCRIIYAAYDSREVVFKGSTKLNASDFTAVGDDIKAILPEESKDKVVMIDLKKYGITSDQLHIYDTGDHGYVSYFDPSYQGDNVQLVFNKQTFTLARYPNGDEYLVVNSIVDKGSKNTLSPGIFKMRSDAAERVKSWHSYEDIWCIGVFNGDWGTISSKVSFDFDTNNVIYDTNCFSSSNSPHSDTPYCFYNVLDELDIPGEYYIDRNNCILYMYPTGDMDTAEIELLVDFDDVMLSGKGLDYVTFMGLTFLGSKDSGASVHDASNITFDRCKFYCVGGKDGYAITLGGNDCTIIECEAHYVTAHGFELYGGEKDTLTRSNSLLENCYVTHWGLTSLVGKKALNIGGCGTTMRHCEAGYSTSTGGFVGDQLGLCEYNIFHDCTKLASDMGALYYGDSYMGCPNTTVRYNLIYNIGSEYADPAAVYWDHGHCSQIAYGNLIINIAGRGFMIGGGRNNAIMNNIIINTGGDAIYYNSMAFDDFHAGDEDTYYKGNFGYVPKTQLWFETIAYLQFIIQDEDDVYDPYFIFNPAMGLISDNIVLNDKASIGNIFTAVMNFSTVRKNYVAKLDNGALASIFENPTSGDYRVSEDSPIWDTISDFDEIPYHLIGRY